MTSQANLRVVDGGRVPAPGEPPRDRDRRPMGPPPLPVIPPPTHHFALIIIGAVVSLAFHGGLVMVALKAQELLKEREEKIVKMFVIENPPPFTIETVIS